MPNLNASITRSKFARLECFPDFLKGFTPKGDLSMADFESVVFWWIVTRCNCHCNIHWKIYC